VATGRIASLPTQDEGRTRFDFEISRLEDGQGRPMRIPGRARIGWYRDAPRLEPGETWRLPVRLKQPVGFRNPGGFDYEGWLFQQRIRATGYVAPGKRVRVQTAPLFNVDRLRLRLRERFLDRFPGQRRAALLVALAVGDSSGVSAGDWRVLTQTGTSHLLAISGLHIALVAALCFGLARRLWPLLGPAALWLPAPRAGAVAAALGAAVYSALAGFGVPTQRALVMVLIWTIAAGFYRRASFTSALAAALLAVLLFDPFAALAPGFWLSFGAVAAIGFGMGARTTAQGWWHRWGRVHLVVAVGLLPLLAYWFHQLPLLTIPANLFAVPWISLLTVPLVLLACLASSFLPALAELLLELALDSIELLWPLLRLLAEPSFSVRGVPDAGPWAIGMALCGGAILLLPRGIPGRWLGAVWMLPLLVPAGELLRAGEFRLTVLDVGQGLAAVARTRNHVLLYDAGPRYGPEFSAGSAVVLPYLRQAGIGRIDLLVVSHADIDHAGGLQEVLESVAVDRILASAPESVPHPAAAACRAGQGWNWDGVEFEILHPPLREDLQGNDRSCVLRARSDSGAALLTGDIEAPAETMLLAGARDRLAARVLIAPHHGSGTSSTAGFVEAVHPDVVVFAAGYRNRFGFPKQDIIARYQRHGARTLDTARSGAIDIRLRRAGVSIHSHRQAHRRFWHSRI
jgi:competence protein ComEC